MMLRRHRGNTERAHEKPCDKLLPEAGPEGIGVQWRVPCPLPGGFRERVAAVGRGPWPWLPAVLGAGDRPAGGLCPHCDPCRTPRPPPPPLRLSRHAEGWLC